MAILSSREQKWDYFFWSGKKDAIIVSHVSNINDSNRTDYMYENFIFRRSIFWYIISDDNIGTRLDALREDVPNGFVHILKYLQIGVFC